MYVKYISLNTTPGLSLTLNLRSSDLLKTMSVSNSGTCDNSLFWEKKVLCWVAALKDLPFSPGRPGNPARPGWPTSPFSPGRPGGPRWPGGPFWRPDSPVHGKNLVKMEIRLKGVDGSKCKVADSNHLKTPNRHPSLTTDYMTASQQEPPECWI